MATFFDDRVCHHAQFIYIYIYFYHFVLLSSNTFLIACTITPRFFSSTTSVLLIFSHFSFVLNRMHWLFCSFSWWPYFSPISLITFILLSAFSLSFANINPSSALKRYVIFGPSIFIPSVFLISSIILYMFSLSITVDAVHAYLSYPTWYFYFNFSIFL